MRGEGFNNPEKGFFEMYIPSINMRVFFVRQKRSPAFNIDQVCLFFYGRDSDIYETETPGTKIIKIIERLKIHEERKLLTSAVDTKKYIKNKRLI